MIQSRGFNIFDLINKTEVVYKIANKPKALSNKVLLDKCFRNRNSSNKQWNKDIIKVIRSLENRAITMKGTTRKITS